MTQVLRYYHVVSIHSSHSHSSHPCNRFAKDSEFRKVESSAIFRESAFTNNVCRFSRALTLRSELAVSVCENKRTSSLEMSSQQGKPRLRGRGRGYGTADTDSSRRRPRPESLTDSGKKYLITATLPFNPRFPFWSTEQN